VQLTANGTEIRLAAELAGRRKEHLMEWKVISERPLYQDQWLDIRMADIELPDGRHLEHRSIRTPPGAGVVAVDHEQRVLLIWRHRHITSEWGWEIPIGKIEDGETPPEAAAREFEEETGWRAGPLRHLIKVRPTPGLSDSEHHIYQASTATHTGNPADAIEAEKIAWISLSDLDSLIAKGDITSGTTLAALLYFLTRPTDNSRPDTAGKSRSAR
jgi:8-oxo-dGTP pyrophosphatase MutT (NUDIX family)